MSDQDAPDKVEKRFTFQPVQFTQKNFVHEWLAMDHVHRWIHGNGLINTLQDLDKFFEGKSICQHWIAYDTETPFAYLITSRIDKSSPDDSELAKYCQKEGEAITLDLFICNLDYLGKGIAVQMIQEFLISKFSHVSEVLIDPEKENSRAVHVYEKAGFKIVAEFIAEWHPVPHWKMVLNMDSLKKIYRSQ